MKNFRDFQWCCEWASTKSLYVCMFFDRYQWCSNDFDGFFINPTCYESQQILHDYLMSFNGFQWVPCWLSIDSMDCSMNLNGIPHILKFWLRHKLNSFCSNLPQHQRSVITGFHHFVTESAEPERPLTYDLLHFSMEFLAFFNPYWGLIWSHVLRINLNPNGRWPPISFIFSPNSS